MNKDLYIEMLEKRVAELEENKKDYDYAINQMEEAINQMEEARQKFADLESKIELVKKQLKHECDLSYRLATSYEKDGEKDSVKYKKLMAESCTYQVAIWLLEDEDFLISRAERAGLV